MSIRMRRNARISDNNHLDNATVTVPADVSYPFSNALNFKKRGRLWKPGVKTFDILIDLHANQQCSFFAIFGEIDKYLGISDQAVITIRANMLNLFTGGEPFTKEAVVTDKGIFADLTDNDNPTGQQYRYWKITVDDSTNPNDLEVSAIYLGDHISFQFNASQQFQFEWVDLTRRASSDSGVVYSVRKSQYAIFNSMGFLYLGTDDRRKIQATTERLGMSMPFLFILDPLEIAYEFQFATVLAYWDQIPQFTHAYLNKFNLSFSLREVV